MYGVWIISSFKLAFKCQLKDKFTAGLVLVSEYVWSSLSSFILIFKCQIKDKFHCRSGLLVSSWFSLLSVQSGQSTVSSEFLWPLTWVKPRVAQKTQSDLTGAVGWLSPLLHHLVSLMINVCRLIAIQAAVPVLPGLPGLRGWSGGGGDCVKEQVWVMVWK